jgi:serine/threonine protein kinase
VKLNTIFLPKSRQDFDDIYLSSELMDTDLHTIIRQPSVLTNDQIQFLVYQILRGLKYIHSAKIIHRDLKPRNLLVNMNCDLKICDFGLARALDCHKDTKGMTDYVATRWYRPPELLLSLTDYDASVDMWAVGCIFAELYKRKPFLPGLDSREQLNLILDTFGTPSEEDIALIPNAKAQRYLRSIPYQPPKDLEILLPKADPLAIDLIKKMMTFNPKKRITTEEALAHPFLKEYYFPEDEPVREPVPCMEFEFDRHDLSREQLKDILYEEILLYHNKDFKQEYMRRVSVNENPYQEIFENENALKPGEKDPEDDDEDEDDS